MKIWTSTNKKDDKIIACIDQIIYKGNPKVENIDYYIRDIKDGKIPTKNFMGIPFSYIKEINYEDNKGYIKVLFNSGSDVFFRITDLDRKREIFEFLKNTVPNSYFEIEKYSKLKAGKEPIIAMVVFFLLFSWTLRTSINMSEGYLYEISTRRSITNIVIALASLGTLNIFLIFGGLIAISFLVYLKKTQKLPTVNRLIRHKQYY